MADARIYEDQDTDHTLDPDALALTNFRLFTQPYDLVISSLIDQIKDQTIHLRQVSDRPKFQRRYVWPEKLASRLIESILLNVPIPPCYLAQDSDFKLDVIDGQQRIFSIYRYIDNQFRLRDLEVRTDLNSKSFFQLSATIQRQIQTYTLRCVIVTNHSDPELKFEVFERLNTSTVPLNAQELRKSVSRGPLIDLLEVLATDKAWLKIFNRKVPDRRMRDEELILRFFAFQVLGLGSYSTPHKHWLNEVADRGRSFDSEQIKRLASLWKSTVRKCLLIFEPNECFRRIPLRPRNVVNRALMDLIMYSLVGVPRRAIERHADTFYERTEQLLQDPEFDDLITRSVDHKSRTLRRFELWADCVTGDLF